MEHILYPISEKMFEEKVDIRFENINEGFNKFESIDLHSLITDLTEEKIIEFIDNAFLLNGEDNSFVDFYLNRLDKIAKDNLLSYLNEEDKEMLLGIENEIKDETVYFRLSREVIPFITRLSTREVLFSTFYFTKYPCTIWGNYNMNFPVFYNNKEDIERYKIKHESNVF
jgi:hypothetical protein